MIFLLSLGRNESWFFIRDKSKNVDVSMLNCFGSIMELGEGDKRALSTVDDSPPSLQVDDTVRILRGTP